MPDALTQARSLSFEFGETFANHAAMVLHAQRKLGASEQDARRFLDAYLASTGLGPIAPAAGPIRREAWAERLGDRGAEAAYRAFFRAELARLGSPDALQRQYLPALLPGIAASALHALMRLAYATDSDDADEVAVSLGYWAACYLPLGDGAGAAPITEEPAAVLLRLAADPRLAGIACDSHLLWHFMCATAREPAFAPVHDWLAIGPDTLRRVARDSLAVFAATMEFCALHAVTGAHWLRLILPRLEPADQARAIRYFWQAIAAVYPRMGCPLPLTPEEAERQRQLPCPDWRVIQAAATASNDEHDISLVYSARCEEAQWGDPLYRFVAARRMGLVEP